MLLRCYLKVVVVCYMCFCWCIFYVQCCMYIKIAVLIIIKKILMTLYFFLFVFMALALSSTLFIIISVHTVHAVLLLVLVFCNITGILVLLNAEYLALIYLIVYIGAIAVLFLFVVMMLNLRLIETSIKQQLKDTFLLSFILFLFIVGEVFFFIFNYLSFEGVSVLEVSVGDIYVDWFRYLSAWDNINAFGYIMYSYFFVQFIMSGLILLVAMLGSILLTLQEHSDLVNYRRQEYFKQSVRDSTLVLRFFSDKKL